MTRVTMGNDPDAAMNALLSWESKLNEWKDKAEKKIAARMARVRDDERVVAAKLAEAQQLLAVRTTLANSLLLHITMV
jgi:hypothetical protein